MKKIICILLIISIFLFAGYKKNKSATANQSQQDDTTVVEEQENPIDITKPMIALTFDDGPSAHTERLLDIFKTYGGKGTFFVMGSILDSRQEALRRIANDGHEIGNHSWSHSSFVESSTGAVRNEIMNTRNKIYEITGVDSILVRPPHGACNERIQALGKELGVSFINWTVDTLDWKTKNANAVYKEIMDYVADGNIVLCHDLHKTTVDAMERAIPDLIEKGYQLVTVLELLTCRGGEIIPGNIYYRQAKQVNS